MFGNPMRKYTRQGSITDYDLSTSSYHSLTEIAQKIQSDEAFEKYLKMLSNQKNKSKEKEECQE